VLGCAVEIDDVVTDARLSSELSAVQLSVAQFFPEELLAWRLALPEIARRGDDRLPRVTRSCFTNQVLRLVGWFPSPSAREKG
jgi:hypothetical protein